MREFGITNMVSYSLGFVSFCLFMWGRQTKSWPEWGSNQSGVDRTRRSAEGTIIGTYTATRRASGAKSRRIWVGKALLFRTRAEYATTSSLLEKYWPPLCAGPAAASRRVSWRDGMAHAIKARRGSIVVGQRRRDERGGRHDFMECANHGRRLYAKRRQWHH